MNQIKPIRPLCQRSENMERLNARLFDAPRRPVKVLQYGEGNFLRAFVDYMLDIANEKAARNANR